MLITSKAMEGSALADWVRSFADNTLPVCLNPTVEQIRSAIADNLPKKLGEVSPLASASDLLDQVLGINVIVEYGREKIGWIATDDPIEAEKMRQIYSSPAYSKARHALAINGHWIFLVRLELLNTYFQEDLIERAPDPLEVYEAFPDLFRIEERLECVVVEL